MTSILQWHCHDLYDRIREKERIPDPLVALFDCGARWEKATREEIGDIRRSLLQLSSWALKQVMNVFRHRDNCSDEIFVELIRTPTMQKRLAGIGMGIKTGTGLGSQSPKKRGCRGGRPVA